MGTHMLIAIGIMRLGTLTTILDAFVCVSEIPPTLFFQGIEWTVAEQAVKGIFISFMTRKILTRLILHELIMFSFFHVDVPLSSSNKN